MRYLKLPGNLPIAKITFGIPNAKLIGPAFIPIAGYKPPETRVPETHVSEAPVPEIGAPKTHVLNAGERKAHEGKTRASKKNGPSAPELKQQTVTKKPREHGDIEDVTRGNFNQTPPEQREESTKQI